MTPRKKTATTGLRAHSFFVHEIRMKDRGGAHTGRILCERILIIGALDGRDRTSVHAEVGIIF